MLFSNTRLKNCFVLRAINFFVLCAVLLGLGFFPSHVNAQMLLNLPEPGAMVTLTPSFNPVIMKGITIHPQDPFLFDFIICPGDDNLQKKDLDQESIKLIKYFMAALTIPEDEMWVNLSPYEKNRIIPNNFGDTEMGRDLLAQDYMLKQLMATLMYPESQLGNDFWNRVYKRAHKEYGVSEIPMNTFNKVWIVPDKAVIYENGASIFVVESHLKVMLEEDYLVLEENRDSKKHGLGDLKKDDLTQISELSAEVIREIIIPEIEKEVNEGKTFSTLRQIANSTILATWYKKNIQQSILHQNYVDKNKTIGIDTEDKIINQKIYNQYIEAFKKGVYDIIKQDYDESTQKLIPRKYFSGGVKNKYILSKAKENQDLAMLVGSLKNSHGYQVRLNGTDSAMLRTREVLYDDLQLDIIDRDNSLANWSLMFQRFKKRALYDPKLFETTHVHFKRGEEEQSLEFSINFPKVVASEEMSNVARYVAHRIFNVLATRGAKQVEITSTENILFSQVEKIFWQTYAKQDQLSPINSLSESIYGQSFEIKKGDITKDLNPAENTYTLGLDQIQPIRVELISEKLQDLSVNAVLLHGGQFVFDEINKNRQETNILSSGKIIVANLGKTSLKIAVVNYDQENVSFVDDPITIKTFIPTNSMESVNQLREKVLNGIQRVLSISGTSKQDILGIGLGLANPVVGGKILKLRTGIPVHLAGEHMNEFARFDQYLSQALDKPTYLINDGDLQALASSRLNNIKNAAIVRFGTTTAASVVDADGQIYSEPGELVKMSIDMGKETPAHRATGVKASPSTHMAWLGITLTATKYLGLHNKYGWNPDIDFFDVGGKDVDVPRILAGWLSDPNATEEQKNDATMVYTEVGYWVAEFAYEIAQHYPIDKVVLGGSLIGGMAGKIIEQSANNTLIESAWGPQKQIIHKMIQLSKEDTPDSLTRLIELTNELIKLKKRNGELKRHPFAKLEKNKMELDPGAQEYIESKVVLITGASGGIGSELSRNLLALKPSKIILIDRNITNAEALQSQLRTLNDSNDVKIEVASFDIRNRDKMHDLFVKHSPNVIFHVAAQRSIAAAQTNVKDTIESNVGATKTLTELAGEFGVERFIYTSTGKVRRYFDNGIYAQSKILAEGIIQSAVKKFQDTRFSVVRFYFTVENSLGDEIFKTQAQSGQPVTLHHPTEIFRPGRSINQAAMALLNAGVYGNRGEIFAIAERADRISLLDAALYRIIEAGRDDVPIKLTTTKGTGYLPQEFLGFVTEGGDVELRQLNSLESSAGYSIKGALLTANPSALDIDEFDKDIEDLLGQSAISDTDESEANLVSALRSRMVNFAINKYTNAEITTIIDILNTAIEPQLIRDAIINLSLHEDIIDVLIGVVASREDIATVNDEQVIRFQHSLNELKVYLEGNETTSLSTRMIENIMKIENDLAQLSSVKGGIDLNPSMYKMETRGPKNNINLKFNNQAVFDSNVNGLIPVIINVTPITNIPLLIGEKVDFVEDRESFI